MNMQDKEFDQIFNSKFEDFEVEPSPMVWGNIADELEGKKGKRGLMPYLRIAAGIIVLLTAGVLFLQKDKPTAQPNNKGTLAANHVKAVAPVITEPAKTQVEPTANTKQVNRVAVAAVHQPKNTSPVNKIIAPVTNTQPVVKQVEPVKADNPQLIAAVTAPIVNPVKATVPDVHLSPRSTDVTAQAPVERPAVMASNDKAEAPVKKRGIHNLGGLINALVAKVDKREDKLIEFSDSDDDDTESNVTGVNLGVIKIKRQ
jgi:cytoskeletal protein RodZ